MHRNKSVNVHQFAMIPKADIPRSTFRVQTSHKTTFDAGYLIPIYVDEILPGDTFNLKMSAFARLATPIAPYMDNLYLDSFFFFVPCRLLWNNWEKFMGAQTNPGDSISYVIPQVTTPADGYAVASLQDYMGLPTIGQLATGATIDHNTLPLRAYNLIWNEWFRDENLQDSVVVDLDDGYDDPDDYVLLRRGKRHDYFTACLPSPQKGDSVGLPLGTTAPVIPTGDNVPRFIGANNPGARSLLMQAGTINTDWSLAGALGFSDEAQWSTTSLVTDLTAATAATVNQLRQAFQIQKLLERDARGGTRYTEVVLSHFGVHSPDARLQRPEYLGGGSSPVGVHQVPQTSSTDATTPQGNLAATSQVLAQGHGFTQSFTEHGYVIGMISVRADLNYQQGIRKMWKRNTRYDFYFPVFAALGEQAVLNQEIFVRGTGTDDDVFGYQERWAEYRYNPAQITGWMKSTTTTPLDFWHLAQEFTALPTLNSTFIQENPPVSRIIAVSVDPGSQFICDTFFDIKETRPMPVNSVPGLIDHF